MVFSSLPIFLDPPNWGQMQMQQHQQQQTLQCLFGGGGGSDHYQHQLMPPPSSSALAPLPDGHGDTTTATAGGAVSSCTSQAAGAQPRPPAVAATTAERARLARVPLPEPGTLRCPRCDSANTKFCYFNNYSLSQPRHFCKACRRYWTRGGALRNVPVGGGCRRNTKRPSKKASRQGGAAAGAAAAASSSSSATSNSTTATTTTAAEALASMQAQLSHLGSLPPAAAALEASLQEGYQYHHYLPLQMQPQFLQHGSYHFADGDGGGVFADGFPRGVASGLLAQLAAVKMTEHNNNGGAAVAAHEQSYWPGSGGGNGWPADFLSGFSSSSSGNVL